MDIQEQIEDTASRVDVASVHSQQLEKKIKQFDKVWIEQDGDDGDGGDNDLEKKMTNKSLWKELFSREYCPPEWKLEAQIVSN